MPDYPCVGDTFPTREELHATIRAAGKSRGYLIKQSITSHKRVTWYCSGKYNGAKCMAGFKGAQGTEDDPNEWVVTEATDHSEACTQSRQRVVSRKSSFAEDTTVSKAVKAALRAKVAASPPSPPPVRKLSTQHTPNPKRPATRRTPSASVQLREASTSPSPSAISASPELRSSPVPGPLNTMLPFTATPPAFVIDSPVSPAFAATSVAPEPISRPRRRRLSSTSSSARSQSVERRERKRSRSHSAGSWYSYTSEPGFASKSDHPLLDTTKRISQDPRQQYDDEGTIVHTILDPSFHFPTPPQQVFLGLPGEEAQAVSMCRRKRSWSGSRYGLP